MKGTIWAENQFQAQPLILKNIFKCLSIVRIMGIIRAIGAWLARFLLVISIALFLVISTGAYFSSRDVALPLFSEIAVSQINESQIKGIYEGINSTCQMQNKEIIETFVNNQTIRINCTRLERGPAEIKVIFKEQVATPMFDSFYYTKCNNIECINLGPQGWLSESLHNFLSSIQGIAFAIVIIFAAMVILLSKGISGKLIGLGIPVLVSGIPYFSIKGVQESIMASMPAGAAAASIALESIFGFVSFRLLILLVFGSLLILVGLVLKYILKIK